MPRPHKCRRVCRLPAHHGFAPTGLSCDAADAPILLGVDEYEAIRLLDLESLTQEECAAQMGVGRTTVTGIYERARRKIADALVNGRALRIEGGDYAVCASPGEACPGKCCHRHCMEATRRPRAAIQRKDEKDESSHSL